MKTLIAATALSLALSGAAFAQAVVAPSSPPPGGPSAFPGDPYAVNGQELNRGKNTVTYGTRLHQGREQPEQKQDMGSESGKQ